MRRTIRTIRQETPSRRESDEVRQGIECSRPTKAVDVLASIRIIQLSQINPVKQEFTCRFDLFLHWDPQHVGDEGAVREKAPDAAHEHMHIHESELAWVPIMRFPNATRYSELMRYYERRPKLGLVGFRSTMDGSFKCVQNLRYFPFDVQAMSIEIQLGREMRSGDDLCLPTFAIAQDPHAANSILVQVDCEWYHRPPRYLLSRTTPLEGKLRYPKYVVVIPCERDFRFYVNNIYVVPGLLVFMTGGVFAIDINDKAGRLTLSATVFLVLIAYKFSLTSLLPRVPYYTELDRYMMFCVIFMFAMYMLDCVIVSLSSQTIWMICSVAVYFVSHAFFWLRKQIARKKELQRIANMGRVDDQLCELLRAHGIVFNASGAIANPELYYAMMDDNDELDKGEEVRRGTVLQEQLENVVLGARRRTSRTPLEVGRGGSVRHSHLSLDQLRSNGSHAVAPVKEAWEETAVPLALRSGAVPVPSSAPGSRADA